MNKTHLVHHGIKGQRWGVRRFQNEDGSLTPAGRRKYDVNADGTVSTKRNYSRNENVKGVLKTAVGTTIMAKTGKRIVDQIKNKRANPNSKVGYLSVIEKVAGMTIGAVVVASGVKNFINANLNKTFNTTGMGATPETFTGKQKTRAQVLSQQKKQEQNKK